MPIPYRDAGDLDELGTAGYLKIDPVGAAGYLGALFLISPRGEPVEFTYNRIDTPHLFLWRPDDIRRHAVRQLATSIFDLCPRQPRLLLCLAGDVGSELFRHDLELSVPVCRLAPAIAPAIAPATPNDDVDDVDGMDVVQASEPLNLFWIPGRPPDESPEARLLRELTTRGLLLEPFERASAGLREVYGARADEAPR